MKKKIIGISIIALLLIAILFATFNSDLGVNAMEKINANYPDNIIILMISRSKAKAMTCQSRVYLSRPVKRV